MDKEFKEIDHARKVLGLDESATLKEVREVYRELSKKYHPDRTGKRDSGERMKEINLAYKLIKDYCESYRFSFKKKEVEDFYSKYVKSFQEDWMWSSVRREDKGGKQVHKGF